jgi:hypothetical protein
VFKQKSNGRQKQLQSGRQQLAQAPMKANLVKVTLSGAMFQKDSGCGEATDPQPCNNNSSTTTNNHGLT